MRKGILCTNRKVLWNRNNLGDSLLWKLFYVMLYDNFGHPLKKIAWILRSFLIIEVISLLEVIFIFGFDASLYKLKIYWLTHSQTANYFDLFWSILTYFDLYGPIWTYLDVIGFIWTYFSKQEINFSKHNMELFYLPQGLWSKKLFYTMFLIFTKEFKIVKTPT